MIQYRDLFHGLEGCIEVCKDPELLIFPKIRIFQIFDICFQATIEFFSPPKLRVPRTARISVFNLLKLKRVRN